MFVVLPNVNTECMVGTSPYDFSLSTNVHNSFFFMWSIVFFPDKSFMEANWLVWELMNATGATNKKNILYIKIKNICTFLL